MRSRPSSSQFSQCSEALPIALKRPKNLRKSDEATLYFYPTSEARGARVPSHVTNPRMARIQAISTITLVHKALMAPRWSARAIKLSRTGGRWQIRSNTAVQPFQHLSQTCVRSSARSIDEGRRIWWFRFAELSIERT